MMSGPFFRKDARLTQADRATGSSEPSPQGFFPDDRPAVTVDCVVFGYDGEELKLLLVERRGEPFAATWALPGGFVRADESLEAAAIRELREETGVADLYLEQLYTFGAPQRDPRGRVISVAYFALVKPSAHVLTAATDATRAGWFPLRQLPALAFDHAEITSVALRRLRAKVRYEPVGFELLPPKFTLSQLQSLYETSLERTLDKRNFRKKALSMGMIVELEELRQGIGRAARLYRFDTSRYRQLKEDGVTFAI